MASDMEAKLKHLEMVQAVITRMATNSFLIKGWSVTLVSALFALAAAGSNKWFVALAYFPVFMFWALDAYFLRQERLFRALYDRVASTPPDEIDLLMDTTSHTGSVQSWPRTLISTTLAMFHGLICAAVLVVVHTLR